MPPTIIRLPQEYDTPATTRAGQRFTYRYAYVRSTDMRMANGRGQDYAAICEDEKHFAFVLCDGVGASFVGDSAARILGDALLEWLWDAKQRFESQQHILADAVSLLHNLTTDATQAVAQFALPINIAPTLRMVLEEKRSRGSESTFCAGLLDTNAGRLILLWLGNSRIRLVGPLGEITKQSLGDSFRVREQWSTRRGPVGQVQCYVTPLAAVRRILVYSDGFAHFDKKHPPFIRGDAALDAAIANDTTDDVSYLEVWIPQAVEGPREQAAAPNPVNVAQEHEPALPVHEHQQSENPGARSPRIQLAVWIGVACLGIVLVQVRRLIKRRKSRGASQMLTRSRGSRASHFSEEHDHAVSA